MRDRRSPLEKVVDYFMNAPIGEAQNALATAKAIVKSRESSTPGTTQTAPRKRGRRAAQPTLPTEGLV